MVTDDEIDEYNKKVDEYNKKIDKENAQDEETE